MLLINQSNSETFAKELDFHFSFSSFHVWNPRDSSLSAFSFTVSASVEDKHHQLPKYQTALAHLVTCRSQCTNSGSQTAIISPHPEKPRNWYGLLKECADRHPHCPHSPVPWAPQAVGSAFPPLCFRSEICCSLMGFLHLMVVPMLYVWWITSPILFQLVFSSSAHSIYTYLNSHLDLIKKSLPVGFLTVDLHVWPDFHGNRSPLTDLTLKGMVRNSLSLQKGQYWGEREKKSLEGAYSSLSCLNYPIGFGFLAAFLMFQ